ncbi:MAG TPA: Hsp20/alpha crystallin family protein [Blastocatellia bacterium]|jgi:HSP20 family protein|nr:Hsp20/alpha crystallin family protein [Blastocatellia bacterium]
MSRHKNAFIERLTNEGSLRRSSGPLWQPAVDIYRCPEGWKIKFDLAGVKPEDIQVLIADDRLIVRGVRRDGVITEGWSYYQLEITYSRFERVLQIPCDLSSADVHTESRDGWLILHIDCNG